MAQRFRLGTIKILLILVVVSIFGNVIKFCSFFWSATCLKIGSVDETCAEEGVLPLYSNNRHEYNLVIMIGNCIVAAGLSMTVILPL